MDFRLKPTDPERLSVWNFVHNNSPFTYAQVATACPMSSHKRSVYLSGLHGAGVFHLCSRKGTTRFYSAQDDAAVQSQQDGKRLGRDGQIWQAMRSLRVFTADDIILTLGNVDKDKSRKEISTYCRHLMAAKYLKVMQRARPANHTRGARLATYQLVRDTGSLPPTVVRKQVVLDQNEDRAVHVIGAVL